MQKTSTVSILIVATVVLSAIIGLLVWQSIQNNPEIPPLGEVTEDVEESLGGQLFDDVVTPGGALPETNPISADTNPFEKSTVNPFDGLNPFEG